ncbi:glycosyltransferase family 2 protein [Alienimonas californiensis]|uniref:Chondroitin synthase n=1 Tax=Alienimonas californiensis TaxID=2527989 RepID=A0A517P8M2_9PLAN|nr:glycosyltransferase family 2 protein [Alienimonas californiensis]QDT15720.1 Chondroitin synthase [Alienimonas californiensis]
MTAPSPPPAAARPRFGIVTPSYNQGAYLRETIESVLSQQGLGTEFDLDYAVIDGGSTDDSAAIIREYEDRLTFWCSEKDRGQSHAINKGFEHVTKDPAAIAAWLNSDDVYLPGALSKVAAYWREHAPDALVGRCQKTDPSGNVYNATVLEEYTFDKLVDWGRHSFMQPGCFLSRRVWDAVGGVNENLWYVMDVELWLKVARDYRFDTLDEPLAAAKSHDQAKTTNLQGRGETWTEHQLMLLKQGAREHVARTMRDQRMAFERLNAEVRGAYALPGVGLLVRAAHKLVRNRMDRDPTYAPPKARSAEPPQTGG